MIPVLLLEVAAILLTAVLAWFGVGAAVDAALAKAGAATSGNVRTAAEVQAQALGSYLKFLGGVLALVVGRVVSARRGRGSIATPLLVPAVCAASALGLALQVGYGSPLERRVWPGPDFALGFLMAALVGALVLVLPRDPVELTAPLVPVLPIFMVATFAVLRVFGSGTEAAEDTLINLGGFQPLELVKLAFVVYLAHYFGRRAAKLRHQRDRLFGLSFPRRRLMLPALLVLAALFGAFVTVKDLGPTLILSVIFLALFYAVTRATGWVAAALAVVGLMIFVATHVPAIAQSPKVALRLHMWLDPWRNAHAFGDQGARALWAVAAGGLWGQGLGVAPATALPAGHTDLAIAHLAEEMGAIGVLLYLLLLGAVALHGLWVAAFNRTAERAFMAAGLSVMLLAQWFVIFGGTMGLLPLTGVVAPFLSAGKTSLIVFVAAAAMLARLAESGAAREATDELYEVRRGVLGLMAASLAALAVGAGTALYLGVFRADEISAKGLVTRLRPEEGRGEILMHIHDPRLRLIAAQIRRGDLLDRNGLPIAGTTEDGRRTYALGDALGTLLGPPRAEVLRPLWMVERLLEARLRGYPELPDGPSVWLAKEADGEDRVLFVIETHQERPEDRQRAEEMAQPGESVRLLPLPAPDFRPLLPLLRAGGRNRPAAIARVSNDVASRTVKLSIDARLQMAASAAVRKAAAGGTAAAAVVLDADSGQVLARAQWPDFDPGDPAFEKRLDEIALGRASQEFVGMYGPWPDKTGLRGIFQGGSAAKLLTAIVAARQGLLGTGNSCPLQVPPVFGCTWRDGQGPAYNRGWYKPIHDYYKDDTHGQVDFARGLEVSCNVYFGQLGLAIGPGPYHQMVKDGLEIGWDDDFDAGKPGSRDLALTAFGQGESMMSVSQAARMVGLVASGGVYRKCPPSMALDATCERRTLLPDPATTSPILAGMLRVAVSGTGAGLAKPPGIRVYGKTGTADSIGLEEERPWGVEVGVYGKPNSWFVAIAEPEQAPSCAPANPGRIALAVVVPRSDLGARVAGPAAMEILAAAQELGYPRTAAAPAAAPPAAAAPAPLPAVPPPPRP
ncbi:MAG TPA: FtsW/RodA/SpoVE family cell cycle protein [Vicinamibacteria bacterium]